MFGGEGSLAPATSPAPAPDTRRADRADTRQASLNAYAAVTVSREAKPVASGLASAAPAGVVLPKTATDAELRMMLGLILCTASLMLMAMRRRRALLLQRWR